MSDHNCQGNNCQSCGLREFERNKYFDGKFLLTRDFQDEQGYLTGKHRLHNSMLHGWGTVCGLKVVQHPNPACRHQFVILQPGLALDCCGSEIAVPAEVTIDIRQEIETVLRAANRFPSEGSPDPVNIYLRLAYQECETDEVQVLLEECEGCGGTDFNRVREGYRLFVDLEDPISEASDPLEARLDWQHTLDVGHPRSISMDRDFDRLYVVDWNGDEGSLRMYNATNHSLITRIPMEGEPGHIARSTLGDRIFVSVNQAEAPAVLVFRQSAIQGDPGNALVGQLTTAFTGPIVALAVSPLDNSLFAIQQNGQVLRWGAEALDTWINGGAADPQPAPTTRDLADGAGSTVAPVDVSLSNDGRWLVVADSTAPRLVVVNLSGFADADPASQIRAFNLPAGDAPAAVEISFDGEFLYVLTVDPADTTDQKLYRVELRDTLEDYIPIIPDEPNTFSVLPLIDPAAPAPHPLAVDLAVSPRDNWVYILRRLFEDDGVPMSRGEVVIVPVEDLDAQRGPDAIDPAAGAELLRLGSNVEGNVLFQRLTHLGQRLYVAGEVPPAGDEASTTGSISILYIDEATCGTYIRRAIDGCAVCDTAEDGVILMSVQGYRWNKNIVDEVEGESVNVIDNFTHRPVVPSTNTLKQVIECMLAKGFSEGVPGPRGPVGPEGPDGPDGPQGERGERGPGITGVTLTTNGTTPTADLDPVDPADPEGDQILVLNLPLPEAPEVKLPHIQAASWYHDEVLSPDEFLNRFAGPEAPGLVVQFDTEIQGQTVHPRSFFALIRGQPQNQNPFNVQTDFIVQMEVQHIIDLDRQEMDINWLLGNPGTVQPEQRDLITKAVPLPEGETADLIIAARLVIPDKMNIDMFRGLNVERVTVVMRGDYVISADKIALDGNNIWPSVPDLLSGNGAPGGDWVSIIHISEDD